MATRTETTQLAVARREAGGSRSARRLRRGGLVPGIVYGGGEDPLSFSVDARTLRNALAAGGAVIDLAVDGGHGLPVIVKDRQRHPVTGDVLHVDLLRVRLDVVIQSLVPLELEGAEEAPGVKEGGVLEHVTREVTVEALPNQIPDVLTLDVSGLDINDTVTLDAVAAPAGVTIVDDDETVVATVTPPRLQVEEEEGIEEETEVVGEDGEPVAAAEGDGGGTEDDGAGE